MGKKRKSELTVRAVIEITRNIVAVRCPTSPMFVVIEATVAGIIETYAPLANPNNTEKTTTPAAVRHIGRKRKMRIPDKRQFGIRIVKGP